MKSTITELQKLMYEEGMNVYYVPAGDPHGSEYVNEHYKTSEFLSGLLAENEELVVTEDAAYIWTDGRFFLQAETELAGSGIELMKMREPGVPTVTEFLTDMIGSYGESHPGEDFVIGFDGTTLPAGTGLSFAKDLGGLLGSDGSDAHVRFVWDKDLGGKVWGSDRPDIEPSRIWELAPYYTGMTADEKIAAVRAEMEKKGADWLLLSNLTETAWMLNLRGGDILYTPIFFSYILMSRDTVRLYTMDGAFADFGITSTGEHAAGSSEGFGCGIDTERTWLPDVLSIVELRDYDEIYADVCAIPEDAKVWLDSSSVNYSLYLGVRNAEGVIDEPTPVSLMKTCKNDTELSCTRAAHIKDGVAVTRFIKWVKEAAAGDHPDDCGNGLTEIVAADYLEDRRREQEGCFDLSFGTISGYGPNGAIVHYAPTPDSDLDIRPEGFLLVDSGGQYYDGTTDITRTIAVGDLTQDMIDNYTRVLKGHIAVARYIITPETTYKEIDDASRAALREAGLDFNHGLGHGVGHVLTVHEGPAGFLKKDEPNELKAGMVVTDEPGVYISGEYGIRIENELILKGSGDGALISEPITCVPYERKAINVSLLTDDELTWLNGYHEWVRDTLTPLLDDETAAFLAEETAPFTR